MGCGGNSATEAQSAQAMMMMGGMGGGSGGPIRFQYFDMHGRGLQCRMVLHYLKGCRWADAPMTQPEFQAAKAAGKNPYGILPCLTLPDGMRLYQSNAIVRFLGKCH